MKTFGTPAMEATAWVAGDWELLPDGLRVIGNDIDAPPLLGADVFFFYGMAMKENP